MLGMQMGSLGSDPKQWLESLPMVKDFDLHSPEENPVFGVIRLNYDRLTLEEQALFMDIVCYSPETKYPRFYKKSREWLCLVHRKKWEEIRVQLQRLKDKGLLEDVDVTSGEFSMHDLYREFAKLEVQGKLKGGSFQSRRFVYANSHIPSELEMMPSGGVWENLIRVGIKERDWWENLIREVRTKEKGREPDEDRGISSLQGIQWRYCSNIVVLKLSGLVHLTEVLNLKDLWCLRSLELWDLEKLGGVEGLKDLKNLTYFRWIRTSGKSEFRDAIRPHLGQLPGSLKVLRVKGVGTTVGRDVFARCTNLCNLKLRYILALDGIDFGHCSSLLILDLSQIIGLQELTGLSTECLQVLRIKNCDVLRDASGFEHSVCLRELCLYYNRALKKVPYLQKLTNLQTLKIEYCGDPSEVRGLDSLRQLRVLHCCNLRILSKLPSLSGLQHLHRLDLGGCYWLTDLEGVGDLPSLRHLNLRGCSSLVRLPDLSKCTNLEELQIRDTDYFGWTLMELGEEDIVMLSKLPWLRPVLISIDDQPGKFFFIKLDVVKRRVRKEMGFEVWSSYNRVKEERDMEMPPIKLCRYKF